MGAFFIIMVSILVLGLLLAIYCLLDFHAQKHGAASGSGRMLYPNACQKYSEVMKQPPVTDASTADYYKNSYNCYCDYYKSCCQKRSQTAIKATNPASSTTERSRHDTSRSSPYPNSYQDYSKVANPPSSTTESSRHKKKSRALSIRILSPVRPPAPTLTSAPSSRSSEQVPQQTNIGRPMASILESVYRTSYASRTPRPINRDRLHCRSRPKNVTFGESRVIRV